MAADGKHNSLPVASRLSENQNNPKEKGKKNSLKCDGSFLIASCYLICQFSVSNTKEYPWQVELKITRDHRIVNDVLERRSAEIKILYEQCHKSGE